MLHTDIPHDFTGDHVHLGIEGWTWCIFANTALGAATPDALAVKSQLWESQRVAR